MHLELLRGRLLIPGRPNPNCTVACCLLSAFSKAIPLISAGGGNFAISVDQLQTQYLGLMGMLLPRRVKIRRQAREKSGPFHTNQLLHPGLFFPPDQHILRKS